MTPIINPIWFYLIDLSSTIKWLSFCLLLILFCIVFIMFFVAMGFDTEEDFKSYIKHAKKYVLFPFVMFLLLYVFLPTKETMTKMIIAQHITVENYEFAKGEVTELIDYIFDKINNKGE